MLCVWKMAMRGRPSAGRRSVLPNLSLAGKREEKATSSLLPKRKSGLKGNRSGKGRGRGAHGGKERLGLIQSSGIFSEGLCDRDSVRRTKLVRSEEGDSIVSILPRVKEEPILDPEKGSTSYTAYEELWASDDEEEIQELSELLRDGFISDIKHGTVLPHVLPIELESQFIDLLDEDAKQCILDREKDMKKEIDVDFKEHMLGEIGEEQEMDDGESPTSKRSRKAARIIQDMLKESREDELFMIQLPSVLTLLCQEKSSEEKVIFNSSNSNGNSKLVGFQVTGPDTSLNSDERTIVEQLPRGRCIGKLVVTKGGRVYLRIGGHSMDLAHTTSEGQYQSVIMVETTPHGQDGNAIENGAPRCGGWLGSDDIKNAVYHVGQIHHHLTASLDWKPLRPIGVENSSSKIFDAFLLSPKKSKSVDVVRMREELNNLQQQISTDVATALKRWNA